jgi:hypothetical protein
MNTHSRPRTTALRPDATGLLAARSRPRLALAATAGALSLLAACGGGGSGGPAAGGGGGSGTATSFAVAGTLERLWTAGGTYTASWRDPANASAPEFQITVSYTPAADAPFEGTTRKSVTQLATFRIAGTVVRTDITTLYFSTAGALQLWGSDNLGGPYAVVTGGSAGLPTTATPGLQGALGASQVWADASKGQLQFNGALSWSVERHDDTTAYVCLNTTLTAPAPATDTATESTCLRSDAAGQIVGARFSITDNGTTVTFR